MGCGVSAIADSNAQDPQQTSNVEPSRISVSRHPPTSNTNTSVLENAPVRFHGVIPFSPARSDRHNQARSHVSPSQSYLNSVYVDPSTPRSRSRVDLESLPSPQVFGGVPETPIGSRVGHFRFFCPLCLHYFPSILTATCCGNYICMSCALGHIIEKSGPLPSHSLPPSPIMGVLCPFCCVDNLSLQETELDEDEAPRSYMESPNTKDLLRKVMCRNMLTPGGPSSNSAVASRLGGIHELADSDGDGADDGEDSHSESAESSVRGVLFGDEDQRLSSNQHGHNHSHRSHSPPSPCTPARGGETGPEDVDTPPATPHAPLAVHTAPRTPPVAMPPTNSLSHLSSPPSLSSSLSLPLPPLLPAHTHGLPSLLPLLPANTSSTSSLPPSPSSLLDAVAPVPASPLPVARSESAVTVTPQRARGRTRSRSGSHSAAAKRAAVTAAAEASATATHAPMADLCACVGVDSPSRAHDRYLSGETFPRAACLDDHADVSSLPSAVTSSVALAHPYRSSAGASAHTTSASTPHASPHSHTLFPSSHSPMSFPSPSSAEAHGTARSPTDWHSPSMHTPQALHTHTPSHTPPRSTATVGCASAPQRPAGGLSARERMVGVACVATDQVDRRGYTRWEEDGDAHAAVVTNLMSVYESLENPTQDGEPEGFINGNTSSRGKMDGGAREGEQGEEKDSGSLRLMSTGSGEHWMKNSRRQVAWLPTGSLSALSASLGRDKNRSFATHADESKDVTPTTQNTQSQNVNVSTNVL